MVWRNGTSRHGEKTLPLKVLEAGEWGRSPNAGERLMGSPYEFQKGATP